MSVRLGSGGRAAGGRGGQAGAGPAAPGDPRAAEGGAGVQERLLQKEQVPR